MSGASLARGGKTPNPTNPPTLRRSERIMMKSSRKEESSSVFDSPPPSSKKPRKVKDSTSKIPEPVTQSSSKQRPISPAEMERRKQLYQEIWAESIKLHKERMKKLVPQ